MNRLFAVLPLVMVAILSSCNGNSSPEPQQVKQELCIELKPGMWVYYCIADSCIVGESTIGNETEDAEWHGRTDWDIAFCETGIRTNSGTSGSGSGGLAAISDSMYESASYHDLMTLQYSVDTLDREVFVPLEK